MKSSPCRTKEEKAVFVDAVSSFLEKYPDPRDLSRISLKKKKRISSLLSETSQGRSGRLRRFQEFDYADFELDEMTLRLTGLTMST
jgi:hypothetical protein